LVDFTLFAPELKQCTRWRIQIHMGDIESTTVELETCPYCGLPIDAGQETATVKGKRMHFSCYQEESGGVLAS
jgi:hypothetical protein